VIFLWVCVGLLLLVLVMAWVRRTVQPAARNHTHNLPDIEEVQAVLQSAVPPRPLVHQIFAREDWEFILKQAPPRAQRMFLEERTQIARTWLRQTNNKVGEVMRLYRTAVRQSPGLRPAAELRLAIGQLSLLIVFVTLNTLMWLRGPFVAKRIVQYAANLADQLCSSATHALLELDPTALSKVKEEGTQR